MDDEMTRLDVSLMFWMYTFQDNKFTHKHQSYYFGPFLREVEKKELNIIYASSMYNLR